MPKFRMAPEHILSLAIEKCDSVTYYASRGCKKRPGRAGSGPCSPPKQSIPPKFQKQNPDPQSSPGHLPALHISNSYAYHSGELRHRLSASGLFSGKQTDHDPHSQGVKHRLEALAVWAIGASRADRPPGPRYGAW